MFDSLDQYYIFTSFLSLVKDLLITECNLRLLLSELIKLRTWRLTDTLSVRESRYKKSRYKKVGIKNVGKKFESPAKI